MKQRTLPKGTFPKPRAPELADFPKTKWGVPIVSEMSEEQKARFVALLGY